MNKINLSYIIATRNRIDFLKILIPILIHTLENDEEIIVVDGNSDDGSKEYLNNLYDKGLIHQYLSEKDKNQAHAWNKGFLMAKGTIIKKLIDDDVYCFKSIRNCKEYMLNNPHIDVCISNDLGLRLYQDFSKIEIHSQLYRYNEWKKGNIKSFFFGDVHMLIRKQSLTHLGLYHTAFTMIDWEYSLRISYLKANIAYYTGYNALSISHPTTISSNVSKQTLIEEGIKARKMYDFKTHLSNWSKLKISLGKLITSKKETITNQTEDEENMSVLYQRYYTFINEYNNQEFEFIS
jgi:glycosyltransferase involved in cell wall biosynthesis